MGATDQPNNDVQEDPNKIGWTLLDALADEIRRDQTFESRHPAAQTILGAIAARDFVTLQILAFPDEERLECEHTYELRDIMDTMDWTAAGAEIHWEIIESTEDWARSGDERVAEECSTRPSTLSEAVARMVQILEQRDASALRAFFREEAPVGFPYLRQLRFALGRTYVPNADLTDQAAAWESLDELAGALTRDLSNPDLIEAMQTVSRQIITAVQDRVIPDLINLSPAGDTPFHHHAVTIEINLRLMGVLDS